MLRILQWELRRRRTAIFWWTVGSLLMSILILALYPSIRDQAAQLNKLINALPPGLRQLKSGGVNSLNVADPVSFLNSQLFYATLPILWIILSVTRGSSLLGKEEQSGTLELLLSRPVSRGRLLAAKAASLLTEFVIIGGTTLVAIIVFAPVFKLHVGAGRLALATAFTAVFCMSFGVIAFTLQAASRLTRHISTAVAVLIGFGGYLLTSLSGLTDWLKAPAKLAPYHYFAPDKIMEGHVPTGLTIYLVGLAILAVVLSYFGFRRRDIG